MKFYLISLIILVLMLPYPLFSQELSPFVKLDPLDEKKPWTHEDFYNDPEVFQFAIVSDRTGGVRPGIFSKAVDKLNLLQPEFVMCVGDLIEGYTDNDQIIDQQWEEFNATLDPLEAPFFFLPGNHDISNQTMREQWQNRFGRSFYAFLYQDVLFICMDTNDGDGVTLSDEQVDYVKEVINKNSNVRWTMLLLHHPIWDYQDLSGFNEIEEALNDRDYTVIAGHRHRYLYEERKDRNYITLATTGGGSALRGAAFGEYDHIVWVTMTSDKGPLMVNISLEGIIEKEIVTPAKRQLGQQLIDAATMPLEVLLSKDAEKGQAHLLLKNSSALPISFTSFLMHHHQFVADQGRWELVVPAGGEKEVSFNFRSIDKNDISTIDPFVMDWELAFQADSLQDMVLRGQEVIEVKPQAEIRILPGQRKFLQSTQVKISYPFKETEIRYTLDGSEPDQQARLYQGPVNLEESSSMRAQVFRNGQAGPILKTDFEKVKAIRSQKLSKPKPGLHYQYYEGNWKLLPQFEDLEPVRTGVTDQLDIVKLAGKREDHFSLRFSGYIKVEKEGMYNFSLRSDDGARLIIAGQTVVDNDGSHSVTTKDGYIALQAGFHPVEIQYFEDFNEEELSVGFRMKTEKTFRKIEDIIYHQ